VAVVVNGAPRRRLPRILGIAALTMVLVFFAGGGWYFSDLIRSDALLVKESPPEYDYRVTGVSAASITFALPGAPTADLVSGEVLGVRWEGGYGLSGEVLSRTGTEIAKTFTLVVGEPPGPGTMAALEGQATPPDPAGAGWEYRTVTYSSAFGEFDAWLVDGESDTWAILIHGRGATPHEGFRILPALTERGIPALLIEYRNDPPAPSTADRLARFGVTEWEEVEGAVRFALDGGATEVILVGFSMGGAMAVSMLYESDLAGSVRGMILDSPALELGAMVDARAGDTMLPLIPARVPTPLTTVAKWMASRRFGADWAAMDYLDGRVTSLRVPILLLHGVEDGTVPISLSRELADRRPDIVQLEEFRGADHVRSWNVDPDRYLAVVGEFLDRIGS
jgi:pimeloyl-ACP methyl ester carboxylesterase